MAKKILTTTEYTDDLDGGNAAGTVSFSFNGQNYEIDLSKRNQAAMEKALKPYIAAARKARPTTRNRRSAGTATTPRRKDLSDIRTWAKENNLPVSDRGRVASNTIEQYDAAH